MSDMVFTYQKPDFKQKSDCFIGCDTNFKIK